MRDLSCQSLVQGGDGVYSDYGGDKSSELGSVVLGGNGGNPLESGNSARSLLRATCLRPATMQHVEFAL